MKVFGGVTVGHRQQVKPSIHDIFFAYEVMEAQAAGSLHIENPRSHKFTLLVCLWTVEPRKSPPDSE